MRNILFLLTFLLVSVYFSQCETDDYCEEEVLTPRLIVRFYDHQGDTIRKVDSLYVWAVGKALLNIQKSTDSIAIPLNPNADFTKFVFFRNLPNLTSTDTVKVNYLRKNIYVSQSCGYKTIFTIQNIEHTNTWLHQVETINNPQTVENESAAHIKIKH